MGAILGGVVVFCALVGLCYRSWQKNRTGSGRFVLRSTKLKPSRGSTGGGGSGSGSEGETADEEQGLRKEITVNPALGMSRAGPPRTSVADLYAFIGAATALQSSRGAGGASKGSSSCSHRPSTPPPYEDPAIDAPPAGSSAASSASPPASTSSESHKAAASAFAFPLDLPPNPPSLFTLPSSVAESNKA
jgi:hypothetical protein